MAKNAVLNEIAEPLMDKARWDSYYSGDTEHHYGECRYAAESWDDIERRIVYKAEVVRHPGRDPKDNLRCLVTNLRNTPRVLYEKVYCYRGEIENRIKESALWSVNRPYQLHEISGQSVSGTDGRSSLCPHARAEIEGQAYLFASCTSGNTARAITEDGSLG